MSMDALYIAAGFIVVSNLGLIVAVISSVMKLSAKFGQMDFQINTNTKDINNAHSKIRDIEKDLYKPINNV